MNMAIIYKLIEVYKLWQGYLLHFPKTSRYTLGKKIDHCFIKITENIYKAQYLIGSRKIPALEEASLKLDLLRFFLKISWEIEALDNKKYAILSKRLDEIGRMLGSWISNLKQKLPLERENKDSCRGGQPDSWS